MSGGVIPVGESTGANRKLNWKLTLCGALLFAFGSGGVLQGASALRTLWFEKPFWVEVPVLVTESRLESTQKPLASGVGVVDAWRPRIAYTYSLEGTTYSGARIKPVEAYRNRAEALSFVDRFPLGSRAIAHANPRDPARAVLDWGNRREAAEPAIGGAIVALAGLTMGIVGLWAPGLAVRKSS
jgi:hypothetical protein